MPRLEFSSQPPYTRNGNTITVSGKCEAGVTVRVMIMLRPATAIDDQSDFNAQYNNPQLVTKSSVMAAAATPGSGGGRATWSVPVPVTGLTPGVEYTIYASDGAGKVVPQQEVTFSN